MRLGSAGEPLRWYISHPAKWGPLTSHFSRLPSEVRMNAPLRVPARTLTLLIYLSPPDFAKSRTRPSRRPPSDFVAGSARAIVRPSRTVPPKLSCQSQRKEEPRVLDAHLGSGRAA